MRITVCGAAGEVTGSSYLVETDRTRVLVDIGMFQGRRATDGKNRDLGPIDPGTLHAVVLTHAHLDHTGRLPLLVAKGFRGPVFATPATREFGALILADSADIQEGDAKRLSMEARRAGRRPVEPLYTRADVERAGPLVRHIAYEQRTEVADGVAVRLFEAGHILGSASIEMHAAGKRVVFSGDLGPKGAPFLRDPAAPPRADLLFLESTYGDRDHRSLDATVAELHGILERALREKCVVLIPSFAIGRAQQVLYHIAELVRGGRLPQFPIYLDSPMAIEATRLYGKHQDLFDAEARALARRGRFREDLEGLRYCSTPDESRALNDVEGPAVIIAGSGMCNGGRILHHLKHHLWREETAVVFVGYQGEGTIGHALVKGARQVSIFGNRIRVAARVFTLGGFSAHAGRTELLRWAEAAIGAGTHVVLTHGEDGPRASLAGAIRERFKVEPRLPLRGEVIEP
ncbi:MAG TPA: MBL fold metallo-hydrolase [Planctomycetota bacterium]|nr:MBL fold metallo-hydrolase [Planctomycetota bacterium]